MKDKFGRKLCPGAIVSFVVYHELGDRVVVCEISAIAHPPGLQERALVSAGNAVWWKFGSELEVVITSGRCYMCNAIVSKERITCCECRNE